MTLPNPRCCSVPGMLCEKCRQAQLVMNNNSAPTVNVPDDELLTVPTIDWREIAHDSLKPPQQQPQGALVLNEAEQPLPGLASYPML